MNNIWKHIVYIDLELNTLQDLGHQQHFFDVIFSFFFL